MDREALKTVIEWCDEKGCTEHEILELIRRITGAQYRQEQEPPPKSSRKKAARPEPHDEQEQIESIFDRR